MSTLMSAKLDNTTNKLAETEIKSQKYKSERDRLWWILIILLIYTFRKPIIRVIKRGIKPI